MDFSLNAFIGYFYYFIYNLVGIVDPSIGTGLVTGPDISWAVYSTLISSATFVQCLIYENNDTLHCTTLLGIGLLSAVWLTCYITEMINPMHALINSLVLAGLYKSLSNLTKYGFQVAMVFKIRSVEGLSPSAILLDFMGALFSMLQMQFDAMSRGHWILFIDPQFNVGKFVLGFICWIYTITLLLQIHVLYPHTILGRGERKGDDSRSCLLQSSNLELSSKL